MSVRISAVPFWKEAQEHNHTKPSNHCTDIRRNESKSSSNENVPAIWEQPIENSVHRTNTISRYISESAFMSILQNDIGTNYNDAFCGCLAIPWLKYPGGNSPAHFRFYRLVAESNINEACTLHWLLEFLSVMMLQGIFDINRRVRYFI